VHNAPAPFRRKLGLLQAVEEPWLPVVAQVARQDVVLCHDEGSDGGEEHSALQYAASKLTSLDSLRVYRSREQKFIITYHKLAFSHLTSHNSQNSHDSSSFLNQKSENINKTGSTFKHSKT
jgi:hypothetical protein